MTQGDRDLEKDREEVLRLHKVWWESNVGLDIPSMTECFPSGPNYLMFNTNGHPYFGLEEKIALWTHYRDQVALTAVDIQIINVDLRGDMAWLACEGTSDVQITGVDGLGTETIDMNKDGVTTMRFRATEIYVRDDGTGKPTWKIWHFHSSPLPPEHEPRPAFDDSCNDRGLGGNPWQAPFSVISQ